MIINGTVTASGNFNNTVFLSPSDQIDTNSTDNEAFVEVAVINAEPVALNDTYTTPEDTLLFISAPGVLLNDTDADLDTLTVAASSPASNGTVILFSNGTFTYDPDPDFNGIDSFSYSVFDGNEFSNTANVTITVTSVNDAPVALNDTYTIPENTELSVLPLGILANDTDAENDSLQSVLVTDVSNGTLSLTTSGDFTYNPDTDFVGIDSFTYNATDLSDMSNTATVTINVTGVNDAPVANDDLRFTPFNTILSNIDVLVNDNDTDSDPLNVTSVTTPSNGTAVINGTDDGITYTPDAEFFGVDTFNYTITDGIENDTATVYVRVGPPIADLNATKLVNIDTTSGGTIFQGSTFNYTIIVTNNGPNTAENVTMFDIIPANVTYVSANVTCSFLDDEVECNLGDMTNGTSIPLEITVTVDSGFVGTLNNTVEVFSHTLDPITSGVDFDFTWGIFGSAEGQFFGPRGIAFDSDGNVYVADISNFRIQKFDSSGTFLLEWGSSGVGDGLFNLPSGVAVDSAGNVYVADSANHRIQKFDSNGNFLLKWGSFGSGDGLFNEPTRVAVDFTGNVYVAEFTGDRIQKFDSDGTFLIKFGSTGSADGLFNEPRDVAVDSDGNVYVADQSNHRIQKFDSSGTFLLKWGSSGSADGNFSSPTGVAVDSAGNVYVADRDNDRIQKLVSI